MNKLILLITFISTINAIECKNNTYLENNECIQCSPHCVENHCHNITGCELCAKNYTVFNKTCVDNTCEKNCEIGKCKNRVCSECIEGYLLVNNTCYENTCPNCELGHCTDGYCNDCIEGYYVYQSICHKCPDHCKTGACFDGVGCVECDTDMELINHNTCQKKAEIINIGNKNINWKLGYMIIGPIFGVLLIINIFIFLIKFISKKRKELKTKLYRFE